MPWIGIYPVVSVFVWSFQQDRHERGGPECGVRLSDVVASALGHSHLVRGGVGTCLPGRPEAANPPPKGPSPSASDGPASAVPVLASLYVPAGVTVAAGTVSSRLFAQKSFGKEQQDCLPRPVAVGADRI